MLDDVGLLCGGSGGLKSGQAAIESRLGEDRDL
jgi:hypothetical protein